jgi:nitric oxide reductase subunit B
VFPFEEIFTMSEVDQNDIGTSHATDLNTGMEVPKKLRDDPVSRVLKWTLLGTAIICFVMIAWATRQTYKDAPMLPDQFVTRDGTVVMSASDIVAGKAGFQEADLMDYGSIYGMGSYFGPDYTARNLVALATETENQLAEATTKTPFSNLAPDDQSRINSAMRQQLHHVDLTQKRVVIPDALAEAMVIVRGDVAAKLLQDNVSEGYSKARSLNAETAAQTAEFLIYSSLTTIAYRPGSEISWTQNWPYEPIVGNAPTSETFIWTWASFCFVFFGFGAVLFIYRVFLSDPDTAPMDPVLVGFRNLTQSQRKTGKYFVFVALVFLLQIGAGSVMAHYYSERASFYGVPVGLFLPYNFLRSVHTQTPLVWIAFSWIGSGLFLAPVISRREAKYQGLFVDILFWASVFVVAGALIGNYLGIMGLIHKGWFWFGNQGLSYLELGRFWQIAFFGALIMWSWMVCRAFWPTRELWRDAAQHFWSGNIRLEHLLWAATINIAVLYVFGMVPLTGIDSSFTITDFWRWWVVHLWVEQSFEFYAAAMSAYLLMGLGLISRKLGERAVYFEIILVFLGGVLGTGHHLYWAGGPNLWIPFGSMFSFIEVLPLALLVLESIEQHRLIKANAQFQYGLAFTYIIGAAFWNFVGAGVFGGGTLNAPLVNYYEHGTFLTLNHAHTSLFGAFGLLGIGLIYFCLRYIAGERYVFKETPGYIAFWLYNAGLVLWITLSFFPIGWAQLNAVYQHGLDYARSMAFYNTVVLWQWLRIVGDIVFAAGAVLMAYDFLIKLRPVMPMRISAIFGGAKTKAIGAPSEGAP